MKLRIVASMGVLSLAGLGLVGAGAHAVFTTSTASSQTITAARMNVVLSSSCATSATNNTDNLTLVNEAPVGSSFETSPCVIQVNNNSAIPVTYMTIALSAANDGTTAGATLESETFACFYGPEVNTNIGIIGFNESVPAAIAQGAVGVSGTIPAYGTDTYIMVFYAGPTTDTGCGTNVPSYSLVPYPNGDGMNPAATALDSSAEGGSFTPTLTLTYSG